MRTSVTFKKVLNEIEVVSTLVLIYFVSPQLRRTIRRNYIKPEATDPRDMLIFNVLEEGLGIVSLLSLCYKRFQLFIL